MQCAIWGMTWIASSCIALIVSAQQSTDESTWDKFRPHALKAWKTYREQFDCVAISGEELLAYELYFDRISGNAIYTMRNRVRPGRGNAFVRHIIVEKDRCTIIEKPALETEFRLVSEFSSAVPEDKEMIQYHQNRIGSILFPLLYVEGGQIDKILEQGDAKVLAVSVDENAPNLVTVEMEIAENLLCFRSQPVESPKMTKVKVVFDAERLWIVKEYGVDWLGERRIGVSHDMVAFLGCAVPGRSFLGSALYSPDGFVATKTDVVKRNWSIISSEVVSSKIAEAWALVGEK